MWLTAVCLPLESVHIGAYNITHELPSASLLPHVPVQSSNSFLPDVCLCAAVSCQLVLSEIGVMGGRDEVVCQRASHVLVNPSMLRVEHTVLLRQHVHGESIGGHELVLLG